MEIHVNGEQLPDVSAEERASHDFSKQILKPRLMGRGHQAERTLQTALRKSGVCDGRERWQQRRT